MKPLTKKDIEPFLKRFNNFQDADFTDIKIINPTKIVFTFFTQDSAREYDWIDLKIEFDTVLDASLIDNSKLNLINMCDGVNLSHNGTNFAFKINNSTTYIKSSYIMYEEKIN
ncbi:MAG: hypothetical protein JXQ66_00550 [Campylobacterales bacterium]|nr:hypothetical protein [Campylobacterales bacterium]